MATPNIIMQLAQLRSNLQDVEDTDKLIQDDLYLAMWLNLKNSDLRKAEASIRDALAWWKTNASSLKQQKFPAALSDKLPMFLDGISRAGLPVAYVRLTALDINGLLSEFPRVDIVRYILQMVIVSQEIALDVHRSRYDQQGDEALKSASATVVIIDGRGFSRKHMPPIKAINMFVQISREVVNLPSTARVAYLIGVSTILLTIVKPLIPVLKALGITLKVYGTDEKTWAADLCQLVDRKTLEEFCDRASKFEK